MPNLPPLEYTGLDVGFPTFVASEAQIRSLSRGKGAPSPHFIEEKSSWAAWLATDHWSCPTTKETGNGPPKRTSELRGFPGEALDEAFQGFQQSKMLGERAKWELALKSK